MPYTVDDLFELPPEWDVRCEVIGGCLIVAPAAAPLHQRVADRVCHVFNHVLPVEVEAISAIAVRLPDGDGPVPDIAVISADATLVPRGVPVGHVHTVVEVVSPKNARHDRLRKRDLYASAGIPCYWRVELQPWRGYRGPLPLVVVRLREDGRWRTILAPAGRMHDLPVAVGRGPDTTAVLTTVSLDPAELIAPRGRCGSPPGSG